MITSRTAANLRRGSFAEKKKAQLTARGKTGMLQQLRAAFTPLQRG